MPAIFIGITGANFCRYWKIIFPVLDVIVPVAGERAVQVLRNAAVLKSEFELLNLLQVLIGFAAYGIFGRVDRWLKRRLIN